MYIYIYKYVYTDDILHMFNYTDKGLLYLLDIYAYEYKVKIQKIYKSYPCIYIYIYISATGPCARRECYKSPALSLQDWLIDYREPPRPRAHLHHLHTLARYFSYTFFYILVALAFSILLPNWLQLAPQLEAKTTQNRSKSPPRSTYSCRRLFSCNLVAVG